jgi:hypothetical protein
MHLPKLYSRGLTVAAAVVCVAVVTTAATLAGASSSAAATPACATPELVVWLDTMGSGAAGSSYYKLEFTNLSGHACTMAGYPGVSAIDLGARQLGSAASRNGEHSEATITLASATTANMAAVTATVVLRITDVGNFPPSNCKPVTAAGLRVYPPGQRTSAVVPFPFRACSRGGPTYLSVEAVQRGIVSDG